MSTFPPPRMIHDVDGQSAAGARFLELYIFCGVCAFFSIVYGALDLKPAAGMAWILGWGPALAVAGWLAVDSRRTGLIGAYDTGLFFCLTWPLTLPWYVWRTRGRSGWPLAVQLYAFALIGTLGYLWGATLRFLVLST